MLCCAALFVICFDCCCCHQSGDVHAAHSGWVTLVYFGHSPWAGFFTSSTRLQSCGYSSWAALCASSAWSMLCMSSLFDCKAQHTPCTQRQNALPPHSPPPPMHSPSGHPAAKHQTRQTQQLPVVRGFVWWPPAWSVITCKAATAAVGAVCIGGFSQAQSIVFTKAHCSFS